MNLLKIIALAGVAAGTLAAGSAQAQSAERPLGPIANQYICVFDRTAVSRANVRATTARVAAQANGRVTRVFENTLRGFVVQASAQAIANIRRTNAFIRYCEQDRVVQFARPGSGGSGSTPQSTPWGITRVGGAADGRGRRAWVIDSGVDLNHPDLNVSQTLSRDFTGSRVGPDDENGHGTHVAGTIAALNNSIGVVGVAAGAEIVAVRVLDRRGSGAYSEVIAGVDYVGTYGRAGEVANMSLGGPVSQALDDAVLAASSQVIFTLAAGNDGGDANLHSPARVNGPNIYTISAIDTNDNLTSWSNYGSPVDYAEPGLNITSTWKDGGYNTISGTSMAAPHAAGVLLMGQIRTSGYAGNDRDGHADPIGHL